MSERSGVRKLAREAAIQIVSGGSAGFVEICMMHPLDVVKTRFQVQHNQLLAAAGEHRYTSIADCFRRMVRSEGFLAIYKGILPPILAETPKRAVKFFTFEQYKKLFAFGGPQTAVSLSLAGLFAGLTEAVFVNPFEVVKVRLQTDKQVVTRQPSTFAVARSIYREAGFGLRGLNLGLTSTMSRNGLFNMFYFGFYFSVKDKLPKIDSEAGTFAMRLATGFVAGTGASMMNIPFDVAKSPHPGSAAGATGHDQVQDLPAERAHSVRGGRFPRALQRPRAQSPSAWSRRRRNVGRVRAHARIPQEKVSWLIASRTQSRAARNSSEKTMKACLFAS
ncbi:hypothetical protein MRX96_037043 [Rhipicephalus microplus]